MISTSEIINSRVLEVLPVIIVVWDSEGTIHSGYSKLAKKVLGNDTDLTGKNIDDVLCDGSGYLTNINSILFGQESDIDFESLMELAPSEISVLSTTYKLTYEPVIEDNNVVAIVVYGRDITQEKTTIERREKESWTNDMLLEIIKDRSLFQTFYNESIKDLHKATRIITSKVINKDSIDKLFRVVHSIKGSGASFKIRSLMSEAYELEHELHINRTEGKIANPRQVERALMKLEKILVRTSRQVINIAGEFSDNFKKIDDEEIDKLREVIVSGDLEKGEEIFQGLALPQLKYYIAERAQSVFAHTLEHLDNKEAELILEVDSIRVVPKVIEALEMSLPHLIRNSLDHGLEEVAERADLGKERLGYLTIKAYVEDTNYIIKLIDDGRGVSPDIVGELAVSKGVLTEDELKELSAQEKQELIFSPGFSTAEEVSEISGRGVGMDSVKMKIEELEGSILLNSVVGEGSTFTITIPIIN